MLNTILCILISIAFVYILANPKVPNSLLFLLLAPILILTHILDAATVWDHQRLRLSDGGIRLRRTDRRDL